MDVWYQYGGYAPKVGTIERQPMIIDIDWYEEVSD
jgi:hypothetical protein